MFSLCLKNTGDHCKDYRPDVKNIRAQTVASLREVHTFVGKDKKRKMQDF